MKRFAGSCAFVLVLIGAAGAKPPRPAMEARPIQSRVLADFSKSSAVGSIVAEHKGITVSVAPGGKGACVTFPKQQKLPSARLWQAAGDKDADWSAFDYLRLTVTNEGTVRSTLWLSFSDESAATDAGRGRFGFGVDPHRRVRVAVPLERFHRAENPGTLDRKKMRRIRLAFERQAVGGRVVLDALRLVKVFRGPRWFGFFDFHDAKRFGFPQSLPVTPESAYRKEVGYGLTEAKGVTAALLAYGKFPVFGDGIGGKKVPFAVDVPNGTYEVQAVAIAQTWSRIRCLDYRIAAEGKTVVDVPRTEEAFYSGEGLYWGADRFHDPRRSLWQQYGREYFKPHVFQVKVADGQLNLDFHRCGVYAAWIYPADQARAGRARVEAIQGEQDWRVNGSIARLIDGPDAGEPVEPDAASRARGYVLFARPYTLKVYPNRNPRPAERVGKLSLCVAPGEYEPTTFAIRPLKDLRKVRVEVSDLTGPGGAVLSRQAVRVDLVKYFPRKVGGIDHMLTPSYLFPVRPLDLPEGFNRQYWLTVHAPGGQAAGRYVGKVTVRPEGGEAGELGLEVRVYPFRLADSPRNHGFFNSRAPNYHMVSLFPGRAEALSRKVINAELADMVAHGVTGVTLPSGEFRSVDKDGGNLKLDWTQAKLYAELLKKHGLDTHEHITGGWNVVSRLLRGGFKEFSPAYNRAYKDMVRQSGAFWKGRGIRAVFQVIDEPRETQLEDWNRNRVDTIKYLRLAREAGGVKTMVTPMADTDGYGNHYTVMIPLMDVWATHCWPRSARSIFLCGTEKLAELWFYNNGLDRFQWGYHLWRSRALADFEWVYAWEARGAPPLIHDVIGIGDNVVPYNLSVLPKINYEWAREGVDDLRYLTTLETALAAKKAPAKAAKQARAFLEALRKALPEYPQTDLVTGAEAGAKYTEGGVKAHFDPWRRQVAEYIIALRSKGGPVRVEEAWAALPKRASEKTKTAVCLLLTDKAPVVDGKLDDAVWKAAPVQGDFISLATGERSAVRTEVRAVCDGKTITFAFHCVEPKYGEMRAYATDRDGDVWMDDAVELFLDTRRDGKTYFQVIVNTLGTIQDGETRDAGWNGAVRTAVRKGKGFWDVEIAVGLASMKAKARRGATWGVNFCRDRQPDPQESSSWTYVGESFHNPSKFGVLKFR